MLRYFFSGIPENLSISLIDSVFRWKTGGNVKLILHLDSVDRDHLLDRLEYIYSYTSVKVRPFIIRRNGGVGGRGGMKGEGMCGRKGGGDFWHK